MFIALLEGMLGGLGITLSLSLSSRLQSFVGNPLVAALPSFVGGFLLLLVLGWVGMIPWPEWSQLPIDPVWMYLGGLAGGVSLALNLVAIARLGLAVGVLAAVMGQLIMSLMIDHWGWFGVVRHPIGLTKILGLILLLGAVMLTQKSVHDRRTSV